MNTDKKEKANRLILLRKMAGLTRAQLSELSNISFNTLTSWELARAGGLTDKGALKIIEAFKNTNILCTKIWLLEGVGEPPYPIDLSDVISPAYIKARSDLSEMEAVNKEAEYFCSLNENSMVTRVLDDSMQPFFSPGDLIGGILIPKQDATLFYEKFCIVRINKKSICRKLFPGDKKDTLTFKCTNEDSEAYDKFIYNVTPEWIAKIVWHRMFNNPV